MVANHTFFTRVKLLEARASLSSANAGATGSITLLQNDTTLTTIDIAGTGAGNYIDAALTATDFESTESLTVLLGADTATGRIDLQLKYLELPG
jgi:hypothetical protein